MSKVDLDDDVLDRLRTYAATWSGFQRDAIHADALDRAARECLKRAMTVHGLLSRAAARDPDVVNTFRQAICVGETYFFRTPEHFAFLNERVLSPLLARGVRSIRVWSAACSTGEEAYSLAACLLDAAPAGVSLEVLGTDLSPESIRRARVGEYRDWSIRETAPIPLPLLHRGTNGCARVDDAVRAIARFAVHDLLEPAPPEFGEFDLILCRNVLVYFDPQTTQTVTRHLAERLAPGGVILFGVLEVNEPPPGLVRIGGPSLAAFARPVPGAPAQPSRRPRPSRAAPAARAKKKATLKPEPRKSSAPRRRSIVPAKAPASDVRARHLDALHLIEKNQNREAMKVLAQIERDAPGYVAGLLDQALLLQKSGQRKLASELMQRILRLTEAVSSETVLPGVEDLPVSYYRSTAEIFLKSARSQR